MGEASLQGLFQLRVDTYFAQHPGLETSDLSISNRRSTVDPSPHGATVEGWIERDAR